MYIPIVQDLMPTTVVLVQVLQLSIVPNAGAKVCVLENYCCSTLMLNNQFQLHLAILVAVYVRIRAYVLNVL